MKKNVPTWAWIVMGVLVVITIVLFYSNLNTVSNEDYSSNLKPSETSTINPTTNFLTYESYTYGIRMKYPIDWTKEEQFLGLVVSFFSPQESASDDFLENLNVVVEDLFVQPMTIDEYTELSIDQVKKIVTDISAIDSSFTTLDGNSARKLVYSGKQGIYDIKYMQILTIKDNKAYVITYTAEINKYTYFLGRIQEMVNSFEIT